MRYQTVKKKYLEEFEVVTVRELGLSGIKNGKLMTYCVENQFDIILTIDKNFMYQQSLDKYPVINVVLNCFTSKIEELITFLPSFKLQVKHCKNIKLTSLTNRANAHQKYLQKLGRRKLCRIICNSVQHWFGLDKQLSANCKSSTFISIFSSSVSRAGRKSIPQPSQSLGRWASL
jgi:hypothetical protein